MNNYKIARITSLVAFMLMQISDMAGERVPLYIKIIPLAVFGFCLFVDPEMRKEDEEKTKNF